MRYSDAITVTIDTASVANNVLNVKFSAIEDTDLDADGLKDICDQYLALVRKKTGTPFPEDPMVQLKLAIEAVFRSCRA